MNIYNKNFINNTKDILNIKNHSSKYLTYKHKIQVNNILNISHDLYDTYTLKEAFLIFEQENTKNMINLFKGWIYYTTSYVIPKFKLNIDLKLYTIYI